MDGNWRQSTRRRSRRPASLFRTATERTLGRSRPLLAGVFKKPASFESLSRVAAQSPVALGGLLLGLVGANSKMLDVEDRERIAIAVARGQRLRLRLSARAMSAPEDGKITPQDARLIARASSTGVPGWSRGCVAAKVARLRSKVSNDDIAAVKAAGRWQACRGRRDLSSSSPRCCVATSTMLPTDIDASCSNRGGRKKKKKKKKKKVAGHVSPKAWRQHHASWISSEIATTPRTSRLRRRRAAAARSGRVSKARKKMTVSPPRRKWNSSRRATVFTWRASRRPRGPMSQHRGGPAGFLNVLDDTTLAFADFRGNRQYISFGNVTANDRVALFLMDYPHRRRLENLPPGSGRRI